MAYITSNLEGVGKDEEDTFEKVDTRFPNDVDAHIEEIKPDFSLTMFRHPHIFHASPKNTHQHSYASLPTCTLHPL